jgi:hypothetical protein
MQAVHFSQSKLPRNPMFDMKLRRERKKGPTGFSLPMSNLDGRDSPAEPPNDPNINLTPPKARRSWLGLGKIS